jgi:uncharacterized protein YjdB
MQNAVMRRCCLLLLGGLAAGCAGGDGGNGPPTITSVVLSGDSTVVLNGTRQITATAMSGATTVTGVTFQWTSSDTTRVTVTQTGLVNGVRLGSSNITALAVVSGTPTTVSSAPKAVRTRIGSIAITPTAAQFPSLGDSVLATAEARDAQFAAVPGITFTWQSRTAGVASATARNATQADLVAIANGTARIVVSGDGVSDSITATVQQVATALSITPSAATLHSIGQTLTPGVTGTDARGNPVPVSVVSWTSTNGAAATVNPATGVVTAVNEGQTDVVGSSGGGSVQDTIAITVDQIPASITISPANFGTPDVLMRTSQTAPFYATVRDSLGNAAAGDSVSWSTDDAGVADVAAAPSLDSTVVTTFALEGTATITATAGSVSAGRVVTVSATPISFATQVLAVFTGAADCDGCHPPSQNLNLEAGQAYGNIVDVTAGQVAALKRVRPFRPDSSYLVHKIQGTQATVGGFGSRMPLGAPALSNATINVIRNWILQGALNN